MSEATKRRILQLYGALARGPLPRGRITFGKALLGLLRLRDTEMVLPVGACRIPLDLAEPQSQYIFFGAYERAERAFIRAVVKPGSTVLDVGAHVGYLSAVMAACVGRNGKVYAFEPDPGNFSRLERTCRSAAGRIVPMPLAVVGPQAPSRTSLYVSSASSMWSSTLPHLAGGPSRAIEVATTTVDGILEQLAVPQPAFVKIDVEGAELGVLQGMRRCLARPDRPIVACELKFEADGATGPGALELLLAASYEAQALDSSGRTRPLSPEQARSLRGTVNLAFVPKGAVAY